MTDENLQCFQQNEFAGISYKENNTLKKVVPVFGIGTHAQSDVHEKETCHKTFLTSEPLSNGLQPPYCLMYESSHLRAAESGWNVPTPGVMQGDPSVQVCG